MQNEISCDAGYAGAMRDSVKRPAQLGVPVDEGSNILNLLARACKRFLKFRLCFRLCFAQSHLDTAVRINFPLSRCFDGEKDHVFEPAGDGRLDPIRLGGRQTAEGFQAQYHVAEFVLVIVDIFAHFQVSLSAARKRLIEGGCQVSQLFLRDQGVPGSSQGFDDPMILPCIQPLAERQQAAFLLEADFVAPALARILRARGTANPCRAADTSAFWHAPGGNEIHVPIASG